MRLSCAVAPQRSPIVEMCKRSPLYLRNRCECMYYRRKARLPTGALWQKRSSLTRGRTRPSSMPSPKLSSRKTSPSGLTGTTCVPPSAGRTPLIRASTPLTTSIVLSADWVVSIPIVAPTLEPLHGLFEMKHCGCLFMRIVSLVSKVTFWSHFAVTKSLDPPEGWRSYRKTGR